MLLICIASFPRYSFWFSRSEQAISALVAIPALVVSLSFPASLNFAISKGRSPHIRQTAAVFIFTLFLIIENPGSHSQGHIPVWTRKTDREKSMISAVPAIVNLADFFIVFQTLQVTWQRPRCTDCSGRRRTSTSALNAAGQLRNRTCEAECRKPLRGRLIHTGGIHMNPVSRLLCRNGRRAARKPSLGTNSRRFLEHERRPVRAAHQPQPEFDEPIAAGVAVAIVIYPRRPLQRAEIHLGTKGVAGEGS